MASDPKRHVLLLASIYLIVEFLWRLIDAGHATELFDWRITAAVLILGALLGIAYLYIFSFFLRWSGKFVGGRATPTAMRAVVAWSLVPMITGSVIILIVHVGLVLSHSTTLHEQERALGISLIAVLGLWSLIATMFMLSYVQGFGFWRTVINYLLGYLLVMLVVTSLLLVRTFLYQPFNIPSGSMKPTLLVGDYFFVSKYPYGYSHYSLPGSFRLFSGRIFAAEPHYGDLVVLRLPRNSSVDYVKRLVGMPGDRIQMIKGVLNINGVAVKQERIEDFVETDRSGRTSHVRRWRETLPSGVTYTTLDLYDGGFYDNTGVYMVPPAHYFVIGDNRDNSLDSRVLSQFGFVPFENLVGRVEMIFFSIDKELSKEPTVRFDRIGMIVR